MTDTLGEEGDEVWGELLKTGWWAGRPSEVHSIYLAYNGYRKMEYRAAKNAKHVSRMPSTPERNDPDLRKCFHASKVAAAGESRPLVQTNLKPCWGRQAVTLEKSISKSQFQLIQIAIFQRADEMSLGAYSLVQKSKAFRRDCVLKRAEYFV